MQREIPAQISNPSHSPPIETAFYPADVAYVELAIHHSFFFLVLFLPPSDAFQHFLFEPSKLRSALPHASPSLAPTFSSRSHLCWLSDATALMCLWLLHLSVEMLPLAAVSLCSLLPDALQGRGALKIYCQGCPWCHTLEWKTRSPCSVGCSYT